MDYKEYFKRDRNFEKVRELWHVVRNVERTRTTYEDQCIFYEAQVAAYRGHTSILIEIAERDPDLSKLVFEF